MIHFALRKVDRMLTTLLCWRAMVLAVAIRNARTREAALHRASELEAFARQRARLAEAGFQLGAPSAARPRLTGAFLRRHLRR
jgi:hypothetical protein